MDPRLPDNLEYRPYKETKTRRMLRLEEEARLAKRKRRRVVQVVKKTTRLQKLWALILRSEPIKTIVEKFFSK